MDNLIGCNITVHLKSDDMKVGGLLIKVDDENVYLQNKTNSTHIIPRENIMYYTTDKLLASKLVLTPEPGKEETNNTGIRVFINGEFFVDVPVPPTMDLSTANERVLKTVWGNPDVQSILRGKLQKTIEYSPGEINIVIADTPQEESSNNEESFNMSGNPMTTYLNPIDMVSRLNNLSKKGQKNE